LLLGFGCVEGLFVRCVNESEGHKTDYTSDKIEMLGDEGHLTEAAFESNEESSCTFRVEDANVSDGSESNKSDDSTEDSSQTGRTIQLTVLSAFSPNDTKIKLDFPLASIENEAVGSLAHALEERLIMAEVPVTTTRMAPPFSLMQMWSSMAC
jgi:hypothetical protein